MAYTGVARLGATFSTATSTAAASTGAIGAQVRVVRVIASAASYIAVNANASSVTGVYLPADSPEYFDVPPGSRVSFVQAVSSGVGFVTEAG